MCPRLHFSANPWLLCRLMFILYISIHPSIHLWRYSPFRALASLIRRLHSSLFAALLLHPLVPSSCSASLWTTSAHLVLGLPTGLVVWKFPFRTFLGILSSSILIIWPAHSSLLILMSSTMILITINTINYINNFICICSSSPRLALLQPADGGTAFKIEGSCECIE